MAAPIALFIVVIGGFIGRHIAMYGRPATVSLLIVIAAMPLLGFTETVTNTPVLHEVVTTIDVEAPPDVVWTHDDRDDENDAAIARQQQRVHGSAWQESQMLHRSAMRG